MKTNLKKVGGLIGISICFLAMNVANAASDTGREEGYILVNGMDACKGLSNAFVDSGFDQFQQGWGTSEICVSASYWTDVPANSFIFRTEVSTEVFPSSKIVAKKAISMNECTQAELALLGTDLVTISGNKYYVLPSCEITDGAAHLILNISQQP